MSAKPRGGQTVYTREIADEICARMAVGETLRQVCRDAKMPAASTVCLWAAEDRDGFAERYARARDELLEHWAEEVVTISDDGSNDWMERETKAGNVVAVIDHEHVKRSELRVNTRKWLLSKLKPERYGERVETVNRTTVTYARAKPKERAKAKDEWQREHANGKANGKDEPTLQ